jgi:hypothetical protein
MRQPTRNPPAHYSATSAPPCRISTRHARLRPAAPSSVAVVPRLSTTSLPHYILLASPPQLRCLPAASAPQVPTAPSLPYLKHLKRHWMAEEEPPTFSTPQFKGRSPTTSLFNLAAVQGTTSLAIPSPTSPSRVQTATPDCLLPHSATGARAFPNLNSILLYERCTHTSNHTHNTPHITE